MTWDEVCHAIALEATGRYSEFALSYAREGLKMKDQTSRSTQAVYILTNLQYWQGERAREVKNELKKFI